jgi:hypothetical protein
MTDEKEPTPVMRAAAEAAKRVATWSKAKQELAKRIITQSSQ